MMRTDQAIERIRSFAKSQGWRPSRYAKEAGLGINTLAGMNRQDWNPSADTLRRLEAVIPLSWQEDGNNRHPAPNVSEQGPRHD